VAAVTCADSPSRNGVSASDATPGRRLDGEPRRGRVPWRTALSEGSVRRNTIANVAGRGWSAILGFLFTPLYVQLLGVESYGLIGFFATLQAVFMLVDMGLSTTLSRELARLSTQPDTEGEQARLVRTLEIIYWSATAVLAFLIVALAPAIATRWIDARALSPNTVQQAVVVMGCVAALQFPFTLYQGGLVGLQRQVLLNTIIIAIGTLRFAGVVPVLWMSPTVTSFFRWQLLVSLLQTVLGAWVLWRSLPGTSKSPRFDALLLRRVWRFAAGMTGISLTVVVLVQMDKILLSNRLTLEGYGYYSLAAFVASGLYVVISPLFAAIFPRFAQLVSVGDEEGLRRLYHVSSQVIAAALLPAALLIAFFARPILLLWSHSEDVASQASALLSVLIIGTALNGLMNVPYAMQLAHGWVRLTLYANLIAIAILVPALLFLTARYGAIGAASVWLALNAGYVIVSQQIMHRRLLRGSLARWYLIDVGRPLLAALVVVGAARLALPDEILNGARGIVLLGVVGCTALAAAIVACSGEAAIVWRRWAR
jgi:O-antigen/teichoic acid export membrane protein